MDCSLWPWNANGNFGGKANYRGVACPAKHSNGLGTYVFLGRLKAGECEQSGSVSAGKIAEVARLTGLGLDPELQSTAAWNLPMGEVHGKISLRHICGSSDETGRWVGHPPPVQSLLYV